MAAHVPASHKSRLLSITGCRYEYQLDGRWPRTARGSLFAPAGLLAATSRLPRGAAREGSRCRRMHHDRSGAIKY